LKQAHEIIRQKKKKVEAVMGGNNLPPPISANSWISFLFLLLALALVPRTKEKKTSLPKQRSISSSFCLFFFSIQLIDPSYVLRIKEISCGRGFTLGKLS
jgi:hypothetical protein